MINTNGIDKKLKACAAISIAFHVVLLSLAIVAAPKHTSGPITIELITAGLTDKTDLSGKKHASIKKASHAAPAHASAAPPKADGGHPADGFPAPSPKPVEEHPMAGEEKQESNTFEAVSMPFVEDYGGSEGNGGSEAKSIASGNRHAAQFLSLVREKIEKAKFYPPWAKKRGYEGVVRVGFTINKDGNLADLHVLRPCHCETLNSAATEAVKKASPFGPVPETFPDEGISIEIDVAYRLTD